LANNSFLPLNTPKYQRRHSAEFSRENGQMFVDRSVPSLNCKNVVRDYGVKNFLDNDAHR